MLDHESGIEEMKTPQCQGGLMEEMITVSGNSHEQFGSNSKRVIGPGGFYKDLQKNHLIRLDYKRIGADPSYTDYQAQEQEFGETVPYNKSRRETPEH